MKIRLVKACALGEQLEAEIPLNSAQEWATKVQPVLQAMDDRLYEMNLRVLEADRRTQKLDPAVAVMVKNVFQVVMGRAMGFEELKVAQLEAQERARGGQNDGGTSQEVQRQVDELVKAVEAV